MQPRASVCFNDLHCTSTLLSPSAVRSRQPGEKLFSSFCSYVVLTFHRSRSPPRPVPSFGLYTMPDKQAVPVISYCKQAVTECPFPFPACGARVYSTGIRLVAPSASFSREFDKIWLAKRRPVLRISFFRFPSKIFASFWGGKIFLGHETGPLFDVYRVNPKVATTVYVWGGCCESWKRGNKKKKKEKKYTCCEEVAETE